MITNTVMMIMCLVTFLRFDRRRFQLQSVTQIISDRGSFGRIAISKCSGIWRDPQPICLIGLNTLRSLLPARLSPRQKAGGGKRCWGDRHSHLLVDPDPSAPMDSSCLPLLWGYPGRPTAADSRKGGPWPGGLGGVLSFEHFSREAAGAAESCHPDCFA